MGQTTTLIIHYRHKDNKNISVAHNDETLYTIPMEEKSEAKYMETRNVKKVEGGYIEEEE